ncbi:hypothetical protein M0P65_05585 [Candidatus Gracilibacteria bacterium]|nr:hypothetical protein [Candidatus Gracilibacteria bacterium]
MFKQNVIELDLPSKEKKLFFEKLKKSNSKLAFQKEENNVIVRGYRGLSRLFYLVYSLEDISNIRKKTLVDGIFLIEKNHLLNFIVECPICGFKQIKTGKIITCDCCKIKYQSF